MRLASSPLAGGASVTVAYRELSDALPAWACPPPPASACPPVVFLHGGWGYNIYPVSVGRFRLLIPDRAGYGQSTPITSLPIDFHRRAAIETAAFLDMLGIDEAVWWGHSDGAVIAAMAGIEMPERTTAVILEALHLYKDKPRSRAFFEQMATDPDGFSPGVITALRDDHGEDRWREVLRLDGQAWLDLAASAATPDADLYDGRLPSLAPPAMVIHGGRDPRSEPGELAAICRALPNAVVECHPAAGHSPHSESVSAKAVADAVAAFIDGLTPGRREGRRPTSP